MSNNLKELRERAGLNRKELAALIPTSPSQITKWENGTARMTDHWMQRIGSALKCSPAALVASPEELEVFLRQVPTVIIAAIAMKASGFAMEHKLSGEALSRIIDSALADYTGESAEDAANLVDKYAKHELRHKDK